nr:MAG TPA: hypothetical protein [Caudoviricetes sp.]
MVSGKTQVFNIPQNSFVTINGFQFSENQISRLEITKYDDADEEDVLFIGLYSGNVEIGDVMAREPYVLNTDSSADTQYYNIKPLKGGV